jgi:hypothetical protein
MNHVVGRKKKDSLLDNSGICGRRIGFGMKYAQSAKILNAVSLCDVSFL